jgi:hypothetical protein
MLLKMKEVYVFKTSVKTEGQIKEAGRLLDSFKSIIKIDFDPEDCDNIVRIESSEMITDKIISLFKANGLYCEELN